MPATRVTLPPATSRALGAGEGIPINIAVNGNTPVTGLHLTPLDLIEKATGRPLANVKWGLCKLGDKCTITTIPSLEVGPHDYWIMPTGDVPPGKYEGTITVASTDKPTGESVGMTLNFSSPQDKFYGFLAILAGLSLGFYVTTFLRRRTDRDQLLIGPAMLRAESDRLRLVLHADSLAKTPEINAQLDALVEALSESRLELAGLPPKIPMPWPANIDRYKSYVDGQTAVLNALRAIVNAGILPLLAARHDDEARDGPLNANETGAFDKAMDGIDEIAHWTAPPRSSHRPGDSYPIRPGLQGRSRKIEGKEQGSPRLRRRRRSQCPHGKASVTGAAAHTHHRRKPPGLGNPRRRHDDHGRLCPDLLQPRLRHLPGYRRLPVVGCRPSGRVGPRGVDHGHGVHSPQHHALKTSARNRLRLRSRPAPFVGRACHMPT